jgi:sec-independent protein translocase protein TatC
MRKLKQKRTINHQRKLPRSAEPASKPFIEHWRELRRRLFYVAITIIGGALAAYAVQQRIINILLKPSHGQDFVYTSPIGGIDFLFRVSLYSGLILSMPVIVYQLLKFLAPLMKDESESFIKRSSVISGVFAFAGIIFGYFIGLPAALHFLLHQFTTGQVKPLITIQSYMSFVMVYMVGAALMFQVPLFIVLINRIKPLKPSELFHYERWVILAAFVMSGLMNPTPNLLDQLMVAGPIILMYQVGIGTIALINRPRWSKHVQQLFEQDLVIQAERLAVSRSAQRLQE